MDGFDIVAASDFNDCLLGIHQDDLPSNGFWCTWSNKRSGSNDNKSMIDRVLSNSAWLNEFPLSKEVFSSSMCVGSLFNYGYHPA